MVKRIQGGMRGLLSAIANEWLDPEDGSSAREEARFYGMSNADRRARDLRDHRREKRDAKRTPF